MILLIDNYDSFTYNLVQYVGDLGYSLVVYRNDQISIQEIANLRPSKIIISPGPGKPIESGICIDTIKFFGSEIPILGVCLGHQSIGEAYGCVIKKATKLMHGKVSSIYHNQEGIFKNLPSPLKATRYHSLVIEKESIVSDLEITAWTEDNVIMGCRHIKYPNLYGLQFHPESILTEYGRQMIQNFLEL
uniref:anthranilate synthase component 2 n=1 Tax=Porphyridium aerugineum TaxID=2792 RepID=UPI001FCD9BA2|nr:anthranilate synthase component 2 [Porphyridium aerugineum]UNJ17945.1 anthranilate synthase component 2 [Porphyridium aerugineum]